MPANNQRPVAQTPVSPRSTAKYTNKDGSKFITVSKGTPSESSLPSTPTTAKPSGPPLDTSNADDEPAPAVNRKKQKRRQKAAARAAAQEAANGHHDDASGRGSALGSTSGRGPADYEEVESDDEHEYILASELTGSTTNGHLHSDSRSKKNRKKKKKGTNADPASPIPETLEPEPHSHLSQGPGMSRDKIWSTSNQVERERIKAFWLGLGEDERKSLVKVEKDAVLKKMKEQQKHTCSCTVCGRKRTAIEEELEGLYDAYYLELEQFANQGEGPPMLPSARDFALRPPRGLPSSYSNRPPSRGRIVEHVGDDEDEDELEEVYSEDEVEEDDYSDDEPPEEFQTSHERDVADFLTFGNSLQVRGTQLLESLLRRYGNMDLGGILTVADDLLKNDGKRFIEMMEQLAERRMAREEDAREHFSRGYGHPNGAYSNPHSHPSPEEDEYDEEEDEEEDYDDSQDEEYEEEEDQLTEEQRMEEGRRMFQIFAARMFEQRVLSAYKEKVAKERQQRLLEEIEAESRESELKKAKKAKDAQKKKDKAAQKKQALAEERARKEAEKAEADAARLEAERQRVAEQKARAEEKRKQKEAQKKAEEEARLRKEAERQRRLHEQREKQAEQERKARESKEKEKKLKEEQRQRDKEAREQKEREAQERKDKQERDKRDKEARAAKAQKDAQAAREAKEKLKEEKAAAQKAASHSSQPIQIPKRGSQHPVSIPTVLPQHPSNPASYASPKIPIATPVLSKASTPIRPRTQSQQYDAAPQSVAPPLTSQDPSPHSLTPHMSPAPIGQRHGSASTQHSHSVSPTNGQPRLPGQSPFQMPPMGMQPPPGLAHHAPPPGFANRMPHEAIFSGYRHAPGAMVPPPGMNGPGRGFSAHMLPMYPQPAPDPFDMGRLSLPSEIPPTMHHRQSSLQFESPPTPAQPIGRPAPIGRPGSLSHGRSSDDKEDETAHLGSRALLEDDEPVEAELHMGSLRNQPPGPITDFTTSPYSAFPLAHNPWGSSVGGHPLPPPGFPNPGFNNPGWGAPSVPPGFGMTSPGSIMSSLRAPVQPKTAMVREMICKACQQIVSSGDSEGYIGIATLKLMVDEMSGDHSISEQDLLNLCETEGSRTNGGGTFSILQDADGPGKHGVRWEPDMSDGFGTPYRAVGAPGEIGSPPPSQATLRGRT